MSEKSNAYRPASVSPPGATLADLLEERGIRQTELAVRMGVTPKFINELIAGKASISATTALSLERTLNVPADFWLAREAHYQAFRARVDSEAELEAQAEWLQELPLKEMITCHWISQASSAAAQVVECLRFFGVASAAAWRDQYVKRVRGSAAWRISEHGRHEEGAIAAWLRQGEIEASRCECAPFDRDLLIKTLDRVRELTLEPDPEKFVPILQTMMSQCGVAVAFIPAPKGCPASGAVRWVAPQKAVVQLSLRYKTNDHLWFTFFHECAHLLLHGKKILFLEGTDMSSKDEDDANYFAREQLIPEGKFQRLREMTPSRQNLESFANSIGIASGIVVGRMQKEGLIEWSSKLNNLKVRYTWD